MSVRLLQRYTSLALGIVYLWFGVLKFFPNASPAEELVELTVERVSFGLLQAPWSIYLVAYWEVVLGMLLLTMKGRRIGALGVMLHLPFTFLPLVLFLELCFDGFPILTLLGQYIVKNLVLLVAAFVLITDVHDK
jgi:uncharacterized membrane protein YkgB